MYCLTSKLTRQLLVEEHGSYFALKLALTHFEHLDRKFCSKFIFVW